MNFNIKTSTIQTFFNKLNKFKTIDVKNINDKIDDNDNFTPAEGGFGVVYKSKIATLNVANKVFKDSTNLIEENANFFIELSILCKLNHELVPRFFGVYHNYENENTHLKNLKIGLLSEFVSGCSFNRLIKSMNPSKLQLTLHLIDLASIIEYIHRMKIIHRDLKPDNVMIDEKFVVKLTS